MSVALFWPSNGRYWPAPRVRYANPACVAGPCSQMAGGGVSIDRGPASASPWRVADSPRAGRKILGDNDLCLVTESAAGGGLALWLADWLNVAGIREQSPGGVSEGVVNDLPQDADMTALAATDSFTHSPTAIIAHRTVLKPLLSDSLRTRLRGMRRRDSPLCR